jgi:hypothetical protein
VAPLTPGLTGDLQTIVTALQTLTVQIGNLIKQVSVSAPAQIPLPLVGVTDGSNAAAGQVGEVIASNNTAGVTLVSTTPANVTSITLPAGDWDVYGEVWFALSGTPPTALVTGISTVSAAFPTNTAVSTARTQFLGTISAATQTLSLRPCRASLAAPTIYYLVAQQNAGGACTATGNIIARRAR